jgi:transposase
VKDGQGLSAVSRELGMSAQTLRNWLKASEVGKLSSSGAKVVTPEQMELSRLRAEKKRLQMELGIAKKAAAFFAKDLLRSSPGLTHSVGTIRCWRCARSFA